MVRQSRCGAAGLSASGSGSVGSGNGMVAHGSPRTARCCVFRRRKTRQSRSVAASFVAAREGRARQSRYGIAGLGQAASVSAAFGPSRCCRAVLVMLGWETLAWFRPGKARRGSHRLVNQRLARRGIARHRSQGIAGQRWSRQRAARHRRRGLMRNGSSRLRMFGLGSLGMFGSG